MYAHMVLPYLFVFFFCQTTSKHLMVNFNFLILPSCFFSFVFVLDYSDTHIFITIISNSRFSSFLKLWFIMWYTILYILNCLVEFCMLLPLPLLIVSLECVFFLCGIFTHYLQTGFDAHLLRRISYFKR